MDLNVINDYKCVLGEGPCWDDELGKLWYIDGLQENCFGTDLHLYDPETGSDRRWHIDRALGCAIPAKDSRVLLNLQDGIFLFDTETRKYEELSDLERDIDNNRLNDGKCDSKGRFWFGSMSRTANQPGVDFEITGSFYSMEHDGTVRKWFEGVGISNGLAWNAEETKLYYVDSTPMAIYSFDFDLEKGEICNRRKIIELDGTDGVPDGMTIDAEGNLWVAHFGGWKVSCWNPEAGVKLSEIALPAAQVTCPAFGGPDYEDLYITTASIGLSAEDRKNQPLAGCTFVVKPGVKGCRPNRF